MSTDRSDRILAGFILGAMAGAGLALLFAPVTGAEARTRLGDTTRRWKEGAADQLGGLKDRLDGAATRIKKAVSGHRDAHARATEEEASSESRDV